MSVAPALQENNNQVILLKGGLAQIVNRENSPVNQQESVPTVELAHIPHLLGQLLQRRAPLAQAGNTRPMLEQLQSTPASIAPQAHTLKTAQL
jgi:hypothetical protein